jgi:protein involved in polysaccharide export with SLBB domain
MAMAITVSGAGACAGHAPTHPPTGPAADILPDEGIGVDDVFDVKVVGETEMTSSYRVAADGTIDFPYVGRLKVEGMTPGEVQQLITKSLREGYLVAPQVLVMMHEWNSRKIAVLGQVNKPGSVIYFPRMTIMDAIAAAGGFTPVAAQNSVKLRREVNGHTQSATFRVSDISEGRAPNVVLMPRDVLFVEERIF